MLHKPTSYPVLGPNTPAWFTILGAHIGLMVWTARIMGRKQTPARMILRGDNIRTALRKNLHDINHYTTVPARRLVLLASYYFYPRCRLTLWCQERGWSAQPGLSYRHRITRLLWRTRGDKSGSSMAWLGNFMRSTRYRFLRQIVRVGPFGIVAVRWIEWGRQNPSYLRFHICSEEVVLAELPVLAMISYRRA